MQMHMLIKHMLVFPSKSYNFQKNSLYEALKSTTNVSKHVYHNTKLKHFNYKTGKILDMVFVSP